MPGNLQSIEETQTLHSGPNGWVKRAFDKKSQQPHILKSEQLFSSIEAETSKLKLSYNILAQLKHKNIVQAIDFNEENNIQTLSMADISGINLVQYRHSFEQKKLPLIDFLNLAIQLADALSYLHSKQVIHKDLHPGNIIINPDTGLVQIIDFGLASQLTREKPTLIPAEYIEGILDYVSPEQTGRMNRPLDYRSDFYTLGVTFYELLSGTLPFSGEDSLGLIYAHIAITEKPLCDLDKNIPKALSDIVSKLLNKSADDRYQSAIALKSDLEKIQHSIDKNINLIDFIPGQNDHFSQFQIPNKLYGREKALAQLMSAYAEIKAGQAKILTVSGYAGIGKSSLINELLRPLAKNQGIFITGKFNQYQNNQSYSAFKQALKIWLQLTLSKPEETLAKIKQRFTEIVGDSAGILIDFLAEFKDLLTNAAIDLQIEGEERKNKLHLTLLDIINEIASEAPLVIFIDDLQWADYGCLELMHFLLKESKSKLLIITAFRDNEVAENHPAKIALDQIDSNQISHITLSPLSTDDIRQLLTDLFHSTSQGIYQLAETINKKTAGNPFFVNELLKHLYSEELINFDLNSQLWCWDIDKIKHVENTDNVIDLMLGKLNKLPKASKKLLQVASCIGTSFDLNQLAGLEHISQQQVLTDLQHAIQHELITESIKASKQYPGSQQVRAKCSSLSFQHDKILQAVYESIDYDTQPIHLKIGRRLKEEFNNGDSRSELLIACVEQLNMASGLISNAQEKNELCLLNLEAARRSKLALSWKEAVNYSKNSIDLLPDNSWKNNYQSTFDAYYYQAQCNYLMGNPEEANHYYSILLQYCQSNVERAKILAKRLVEFIGRGQWVKGIELGLKALSELNISIEFDSNNIQPAIEIEKNKLDSNLSITPLERVTQLPKSSVESHLIASNLITNLCACYYILSRTDEMAITAYRGINLLYNNGINNEAAALLSWLACLQSFQNHNIEANKTADIVLDIIDSNPQSNQISSSLNILAGLVKYCHQPYNDSIELHMKAYHMGLNKGELARGMINLSNTLFFSFSKGEGLSDVINKAIKFKVMANNKSIFIPMLDHTRLTALALKNPDDKHYHSLDHEVLGEQYISKIKNSIHENNLINFRSFIKFWSGKHEEAIPDFQEVHKYFISSTRFCIHLDHVTLFPLALLFTGQGKCQDHIPTINFCLNELKRLNDIYPNNHEHKYNLLLAEVLRANNSEMENIIDHYTLAISSAKANNFIQYEALANERLASFLLNKKLKDAAARYFQIAHRLYKIWGCNARNNYLESSHPELADHSEPSSRFSNSSGSTGLYSHKSSDNLDFESILKSSQLISSKLNFTDLGNKVMEVILENSAAQSGALILKSKNEIVLQSYIDASGKSIQEPLSLEETNFLPKQLITYVLRTNKLFLQQEDNNLFPVEDPYLETVKPKSILCMPVNYRGKSIGVLYLEHKQIEMAFPNKRLNTIQVLLKQAAISLDNSQLFDQVNKLNKNLESKVDERTKELEKTRDKLVQSEKMASLATLIAGISHEMNTPLGNSITAASFSRDVIDGINNSFKNNTLTASELSDNLERYLESDALLQTSLSKINELVILFKTILINPEDEIREAADFSPLEQLNLLSTELSQSLQQGGHKLTINCPETIEMFGYCHYFEQVFSQLITNAIIHGFENKQQGEISISLTSDRENITILVEDNGSGMSEKLSQTMFDPFVTTKRGSQKNTGLGGHILYNLVTYKLKGQIECHSQLGKGTQFKLILPKSISGL